MFSRRTFLAAPTVFPAMQATQVNATESYASAGTLIRAQADAMRGALAIGQTVLVDGFESPGDGGGFLGLVQANDSLANPGGGRIRPVAPPITFEMYGAKGDGSTDDTGAIKAAFESGFDAVYGQGGKEYAFRPLSIDTDALKRIDCIGGNCTFVTLPDGSGRAGLTLPRNPFFHLANVHFRSSGNGKDQMNTVGLLVLRVPIVQIGPNVRFQNYSGIALRIIQCVHARLDRVVVNMPPSIGIGISLERHGKVPCTTVIATHPYLFGGRNALRSQGTVCLMLEQPITEDAGDANLPEGSLHLIGGSAVVTQPYFERSKRNLVALECLLEVRGRGFGFVSKTRAAPDIVTYKNMNFDLRGAAQMTNTDLNIRRIGPDQLAKEDLTIGDNLRVPYGGGSVAFGETTTERLAGTLRPGGWTTVHTFKDQSGPNSRRASYRYTAYIGENGPFDSGTILNGVLSSDTYTTPPEFRMAGGELQFYNSAPSDSPFAITLLRTQPGGARA